MQIAHDITFDPDDLAAHQAFLRRLARRLVSDAHRAEDLAQQANLRALERPPLWPDVGLETKVKPPPASKGSPASAFGLHGAP